jgi:peptidoglycan/LPS O-acetylase OafA/YrhL
MKVRLHEIDVLRGLAALCVVLFHYTTHFNKKFGHQDTLLFDMPLLLYILNSYKKHKEVGLNSVS